MFKVFKPNGVLAAEVKTLKEAFASCDRQKDWYWECDRKLTRDELIQSITRDCINEELKKYGITFSDVIKGGKHALASVPTLETRSYLWGLIKFKVNKIKFVDWYLYYTFDTVEEYEQWKKFCITLLRKKLKMTIAQAEFEFSQMTLAFGLRDAYKVDKP